jgi:signal peptidase I
MNTYLRDSIGLFILIVLIIIFTNLVLSTYLVENDSMRPELQVGDRLLVNKLAYNFNQPERGEIVLYKDPEEDMEQMVRIIGLPGDLVEVKNKHVYLNEVEVTDLNLKTLPGFTLDEHVVPPLSYFIMGNVASDSKIPLATNIVSRYDIVGKVWITAWPPDHWGSPDNFMLGSQFTLEDSSVPSVNP